MSDDLNVDDLVLLKHTGRSGGVPKFLDGRLATVKKVKRTSVDVQLDNGEDRCVGRESVVALGAGEWPHGIRAVPADDRQERVLNKCSAPCPAQGWASPCFLQKGHEGQHGNGWRRW